MAIVHINPNKRRNRIESYPLLAEAKQKEMFPEYLSNLKINKFRHLRNIKIAFKSPITVISGSNKTGKSSILLSIGCSHFNFLTKSATTGKYERTRWGDVMRFTACDIQNEDWSYEIKCREKGGNITAHSGKRNHLSKKWSGCAKKEGQIGTPGPHRNVSPNGRKVYLLDLERIIPGRHHPISVFSSVRTSRPKRVKKDVNLYLSYILENRYNAFELGGLGERVVYAYKNANDYSSFNSASGEDVLTKMLIDIVNAPDKSLILIEEIEIGLHPKIQRRLMDILYCESVRAKKQFIVTTHSSTILSSVNADSRILLYKRPDDTIAVKDHVSICGALSSMDSISHPLLSIYVEDDISARLVREAIQMILPSNPEIRRLVKIVEVGSADQTYEYFRKRQATESSDCLQRGYACILDGDKRNETYRNGSLQFPPQEGLFFHHSDSAPETMLLKYFLLTHHNDTLRYHAEQGNAHNLMQKIVDEGLAASPNQAMEDCIKCLKATPEGQQYFEDLTRFIIEQCDKFETEF